MRCQQPQSTVMCSPWLPERMRLMRHPQTAQRQMARVLDRCWDVAVRAWGPGGIKKVGREWLGIIFIFENDFNLRTPGPWISEPRWKDEMQWMWTKSKSWCYIMNLQSFSGRRGLGCKTMISPCLRLTSTASMLNRQCILNVVLNIKCGH